MGWGPGGDGVLGADNGGEAAELGLGREFEMPLGHQWALGGRSRWGEAGTGVYVGVKSVWLALRAGRRHPHPPASAPRQNKGV